MILLAISGSEFNSRSDFVSETLFPAERHPDEKQSVHKIRHVEINKFVFFTILPDF